MDGGKTRRSIGRLTWALYIAGGMMLSGTVVDIVGRIFNLVHP